MNSGRGASWIDPRTSGRLQKARENFISGEGLAGATAGVKYQAARVARMA